MVQKVLKKGHASHEGNFVPGGGALRTKSTDIRTIRQSDNQTMDRTRPSVLSGTVADLIDYIAHGPQFPHQFCNSPKFAQPPKCVTVTPATLQY